MPIVGSDFRPLRGLSNPHAQTVLASRHARPPPFATRRERLELDDGDFLDLAHGEPAQPRRTVRDEAQVLARAGLPEGTTSIDDDTPVVALFHGLAGSLESVYVQGAMAALSARGFRSCLMHWRGCSGEPNRLARSYHSGASDDIGRLVALLRARHPRSALYGVGYSLGGNALLKYLGERGEDTPLASALAVSPPLVLSVGAKRLDHGFARVYRGHLLGLMRAQHEAKRRRHPELGLPPASAELNTFRRFDDALTAPLHGYAGVDDYYTRCSGRAWLGTIRRPTHILSARDDPFFTEAILPEADELARGTTLEISEHGGHVGFLAAGRDIGERRWLDRRVADVIANFHDTATRPERLSRSAPARR